MSGKNKKNFVMIASVFIIALFIITSISSSIKTTYPDENKNCSQFCTLDTGSCPGTCLESAKNFFSAFPAVQSAIDMVKNVLTTYRFSSIVAMTYTVYEIITPFVKTAPWLVAFTIALAIDLCLNICNVAAL
ncbi:MAG: hypothetical protein JSW62_05665 [Thermoplasmatales archaeon]|nr:MAG: hypothetical protein JSW62_05665 [Thermoplasmatales archaeon]